MILTLFIKKGKNYEVVENHDHAGIDADANGILE